MTEWLIMLDSRCKENYEKKKQAAILVEAAAVHTGFPYLQFACVACMEKNVACINHNKEKCIKMALIWHT